MAGELEKRSEAAWRYNWLPPVPFPGLLSTLENWPTSLQVLLQKSECPLGGGTRLYGAKSRVRKYRPLSQLLQEPQEIRCPTGFPDKPFPDSLLNAALDSGASPQVQKVQDLWSEAPNTARVEGQEKPSSYTIRIGGHGLHYLLRNSAAFPVDLSKPKFFCS